MQEGFSVSGVGGEISPFVSISKEKPEEETDARLISVMSLPSQFTHFLHVRLKLDTHQQRELSQPWEHRRYWNECVTLCFTKYYEPTYQSQHSLFTLYKTAMDARERKDVKQTHTQSSS